MDPARYVTAWITGTTAKCRQSATWMKMHPRKMQGQTTGGGDDEDDDDDDDDDDEKVSTWFGK